MLGLWEGAREAVGLVLGKALGALEGGIDVEGDSDGSCDVDGETESDGLKEG